MNKCDADRILRFCIRVINGEAVLAPYNVILSFLIGSCKRLEQEGYVGHAKILEHWIHRFQSKRGFLKTLQPPKAVDREHELAGGSHEF